MADKKALESVNNNNLSIGLIFGLVTQGAAIVWTVSMMMSDIEDNREDIIKTQLNIQRLNLAVQTQAISNMERSP